VAWPIVLDACVLVPGGLRDDLLSVAEAAIYQPVWSSGILIEVDRTLRDRFKLTAAQTAYLLGEIRRAFPNAEVEDWESRLGWVPEAVEAEDRHVVAAALQGGSQDHRDRECPAFRSDRGLPGCRHRDQATR
jgi:PIN domain